MTIPSPLQSYLSLIETRRSHYGLSPKSPISDEAIYDILTQAIKHVPTAFNSQTGRVVLVLGEKHTELWDAVFEGLMDTFDGDAEREERNKKRFETSFKSGYGTIVFFEDQDRLKELGIKSPDFAELFPVWSHNSAGMLQHTVWTALSAEGLGANLQHYGSISPKIEDSIRYLLDVPSSWTSTALMPFGTPTGHPGGAYEKTFEPLEDRVKVVSG